MRTRGPYLTQDVDPTDIRKIQIQDDQMGLFLLQEVNHLASSGGNSHVIVFGFETARHILRDGDIVFYNEDVHGGQPFCEPCRFNEGGD